MRTPKHQPRSGTATANAHWLRRLVRLRHGFLRVFHVRKKKNAETASTTNTIMRSFQNQNEGRYERRNTHSGGLAPHKQKCARKTQPPPKPTIYSLL